MMSRFSSIPIFLLLLVVFAALVGACGGDDSTSNTAAVAAGESQAAASPTPRDVTLRLGYFPNITHAQPLIGVENGTYTKELGSHVKLETKTFNAGPDEVQALFAGDLDAAYLGPSPAVNGYVKSKGEAFQIVAGAASGGVLLVVRPGANINTAADLANKKIADPQLGNTQDVALKTFLKDNGLKPKEDGGNVTVLPTANPDTLTLFKKGDIDGAWVPEPWASRLIVEAGGKPFLDERSLWANGQFVVTNLVVSTKFLKDHPDVVESLLRAQVKTTDFINANPDQAKEVVNQAIGKITGAALSPAVVESAWKNLTFTDDPLAATLMKSADDAFNLGFLGSSKPDLSKFYSLDLLNKALAAENQPGVHE